jgi:hypothetical protein
MAQSKILGSTIAAVIALSALATSSAMAAPEFIHCVAKAGGTFGAGCTAAGSGFAKVAVPTGSKIKYTDKEGTSNFFVKNEITFTCTQDTSKGEITGSTTMAKITVRFTGCTAKKGANPPCSAQNLHGTPGVIVINELKGLLGNASETKTGSTVPGEGLEPEAGAGEVVTLEASCVKPEVSEIVGGVIGEVTPVNVLSSKGNLDFGCIPTSITQQLLGFLNGTENVLKTFGSVGCFESKDEITFAEAIEVT